MSTSADRAEQEVKQSREKLVRTLDDLQSRFSQLDPRRQVRDHGLQPRQLNDTAQKILSVVRRDPIPALMIGAGVCWLVYESFTQTARTTRRASVSRTMTPGRVAGAPGSSAEAVEDDERLEHALHETMAGSDPVAVRITK